METLLIGIAGGSGSGKTTLANRLAESFPKEKVTLIRHDSYYKRRDDMDYEARAQVNYDEPEAFDTPLLREHIMKLRAGESIEEPVYDYTIHNRSDRTVLRTPAPVIILEGILIFTEREIRDLMDIRVFVDTDADERILRRAKRDMRDRGRSIESVIEQYLTTVKPMHERYVEPSKQYADLIVPRGGKNPVALRMLISEVQARLKDMGQE